MHNTARYVVALVVLLLGACVALFAQGVVTSDGTRWTVVGVTVADNSVGASAASGTVTVLKSYVEVTCNDADGCNMTISETGAREGMRLTVVNVSANTATFADTSGVSEIAGSFSAGQYDAISYIYIGDRWVEMARSNN